MMRFLPAVFFGLVASVFAAEEEKGLVEKYAGLGRVIVGPFASAPFPHPARAEGHTYDQKLYTAAEHYSDSTVAIFIPKNFRPTKRIDVVVHFHGWRNTVAGTLEQFHLAEQLVASGRNAILVVPEGPHDAPDSFGGKLEDEGGFRRFMDELAVTLRREKDFAPADFSFGRIILSGHSGGYHVMGSILARGGMDSSIAEVWLFDALYGQTEHFVAWADRSHGRLIDIYTDHGGTKDESEKLMARLKARGASFIFAEDAKLDSAALMSAGYVFLHTDLAHNDVLATRGQFRLYLSTSALAERSSAAGAPLPR